MKTALAVALISMSSVALADQQCSYYGHQLICLDQPSYSDVQVNDQIPLIDDQQSFANTFQQVELIRNEHSQNQLMLQQLMQMP